MDDNSKILDSLSREELIRDIIRQRNQIAEINEQITEYKEQIAKKDELITKKDEQIITQQGRLQKTALLECLENCHEHLYSKFRVQPNPKLTTKGSLTGVRNKCCPSQLRPWDDFLDTQKEMVGILVSMLPESKRLFESQEVIQGIGERLSRFIGSERDLELFHHSALEDPVQIIIHQLVENKKHLGTAPFDVGYGVHFENHMNVLDEPNEVDEGQPQGQPRTPVRQRASSPVEPGPQIRPDQICVFRTKRDTDMELIRILAFILEYKSPAKLTKLHVRAGVQPMSIIDEVVNRVTIPTKEDPDGRFLYFATQMSAMAITQTYHYMLQAGLQFGVLTTGEVMVFLKIDWSQPSTLFYHVAEPLAEVEAHPSNFRYCTAVSQLLAFTLMAIMGPEQRPQDVRNQAVKNSETWEKDWEHILQEMSADDLTPPPSSGALYAPSTYSDIDRSPIQLRLRRRVPQDRHLNASSTNYRDPSNSSGDEGVGSMGDPRPSMSRKRAASQQLSREQPPQQQQQQEQEPQQRPHATPQYCTHRCLAGLVKGTALDMACPNRDQHVRAGGQEASGSNHALSHSEFLHLLHEQFRETLDRGIKPLSGVYGARGVLFRVTLLAYGYTFVAKGTRAGLVKHLRHEASVYRRMAPIQGIHVPVFLGTVDLRDVDRCYFYDHCTRIVFFVLLSWGGVTVARGDDKRMQFEQAVRRLRALGVSHNDLRRENVLWDVTQSRLMLIDFERSTLKDLQPVPPRNVTPKKRTQSDAFDADVEETADKALKKLSSPEKKSTIPV